MTPDQYRKTVRVPRHPAWTAVVCLAASLAGCGDKNDPLRSASFYPVKGKITLPDGKPLGGVKVNFAGPASSNAITESDGSFVIKGTKDGLPAGEYSVYLEGNATVKGSTKKVTLPFPAKYLDEASSDLKAKVTPEGPNDFDLKLNKEEPTIGTKRPTK